MNHQKILLFALGILIVSLCPGSLYTTALDYNGNPINKNGITLTPQTSSILITNYTQAINLDGLVDQTFGNGGIVTTNIGGANDTAYAAAIQSDGKIIAVGSTDKNGQNDWALVRYQTNGAIDPTFGTNGVVITNPGGTANVANACVLQPDGKIITVGWVRNAGPGYDWAIARYNSNGTLDTSFGTNGITITSLGGSHDEPYACLLQPDGKIIVIGDSDPAIAFNYDFAIARYKTDGTIDTSFGTNGITITNLGGTSDIAFAGVIQPDGKIVVAGQTNRNGGDFDFALVRYKTDGTLDTTFGTNGTTTTSVGGNTDEAYACALQPDGKIIAAGHTNVNGGRDFVIVRYSSEGIIDSTFGTNGITITNVGGTDDRAHACVLQPDGKTIIAGFTNRNAGNFDFALARYQTNGTIDPTFGTNGIVVTSLGGATDKSTACTLQPDGKIVVVGYANPNGGSDFAVARYINPFTLTSFTASYGSIGLI